MNGIKQSELLTKIAKAFNERGIEIIQASFNDNQGEFTLKITVWNEELLKKESIQAQLQTE